MQRAPSEQDLVDAIAIATEAAFLDLRSRHPGNFYYVTLITSGDGDPPFLTAWSEEALMKQAQLENDPEVALELLRWSYADSPFMAYGERHFERVRQLFEARPRMDSECVTGGWEREYEIRLGAMEAAMAALDSKGLFGTGADRLRVVISAEVMPPDASNLERVRRLNPHAALERLSYCGGL